MSTPILSVTGMVVNRNNTPTDIDIYTAKIDAEQSLAKEKSVMDAKSIFCKNKKYI